MARKGNFINEAGNDIVVEYRQSLQVKGSRSKADYHKIKNRIDNFLVTFNFLAMSRKNGENVPQLFALNELKRRLSLKTLPNRVKISKVLQGHNAEVLKINAQHPYPLNAVRITWENYYDRVNKITELNKKDSKILEDLIGGEN